MSSRLPSYLRALRRSWGLSQDEVASLLGLTSPSQVSRFERDERLPNLDVLIAYEVLLRKSARGLFPTRYSKIESRVMDSAAQLLERLEHDNSRRGARVRELLEQVTSLAVTQSPESDV
jgi:transcriptional regulator with XRE-family HTH domain